jgi:predicted RNA-binding protein with PIN domain/regulator of replication initiation timing
VTGPLPELVRARVVALAADALGAIEPERLPAALRKVASFAPARRARLAGSVIADVLARDDEFRERVAVHVRDAMPEVAEAVGRGRPDEHAASGAAPVDVASLAYLLRPDGWTDLVARATERLAADRETAREREETGRAARLEHQLESLHARLKEVRAEHREQVARLKAENADLRLRLGDVRSRLRAAELSAEQTRATAGVEATAAAARQADAEAELRRVRSRLDQLERDLTAARRTERADRGTESLRTRLLVDTLLETAQGLRRELALPTVEGWSPADAVEALTAEHGSRTSSGHGSLAPDDPVLLDQILALPRVHLVVDGYNVTKTAWPDLSLERQRDRLLAGLAPLAARSGAEVTVVFDAAGATERPLVTRPRGVRVLYSAPGVIADDVIRDLVAAEPPGRPVVVVSSDRQVVTDVARAGARTVAAPALSRLLARS